VLVLVIVALSLGAGIAWAAVKNDSGHASKASKPATRMHNVAGMQTRATHHGHCPNMRSNTGSTSYAPDV
jgi:hypothetical protein